MNVKQIYGIVNDVTTDVLGGQSLLTEDLSNLTDVGTSVLTNTNLKECYVKAIVNKIGKVYFKDRTYKGLLPSILMDKWKYGSIAEKIRMDLPQATANESFQLTDNNSYDPNVFKAPSVEEKFFTSLDTWEIPMSITDIQLKQSFKSAEDMGRFLGMIYTMIDNSATLKLDSLKLRTIDNMVAETIYDAKNNSGVGKAYDLLNEYATLVDTTSTLTANTCMYDKNFLKYASKRINEILKSTRAYSKIFNLGAKETFTPTDKLHCVMLDKFETSCQFYLESDTFNEELVKLPLHDSVPYWQGCGTNFSFDVVSKIKCKTSENHSVEYGGIIAVGFDDEALGVQMPDERITSQYNAKAEFTNLWYKYDARYFNDFNENMVVFYVEVNPNNV